jgi:hypothetical protein
MSDNLVTAASRLECATRALSTYLSLRAGAATADPEYQRLWQDRRAAEQAYRTSLAAPLANQGATRLAAPSAIGSDQASPPAIGLAADSR